MNGSGISVIGLVKDSASLSTGKGAYWHYGGNSTAQDEHHNEYQNDDGLTVNRHHYIATHPKARHNPVLAWRLIQSHATPREADKKLSNSPRILSRFTFRFMEERVSGWELFTDEERNELAFIHSMSHNDDNGYRASLRAAENALYRYMNKPSQRELVRQAKALYREHKESQKQAAARKQATSPDVALFGWHQGG